MIFNPSRSKLTPENHLPNYQLSPTMELMNIFSTSILNPPCPVVFGHYQDKCIQLSVLSYILTTVLFLLFPPSSNFPLPPSYPKLSSRFTLLHDKKKNKQTTPTSSKTLLLALSQSCFSSDPLKGCLFFHLSLTPTFWCRVMVPIITPSQFPVRISVPCAIPAPWNYVGGF